MQEKYDIIYFNIYMYNISLELSVVAITKQLQKYFATYYNCPHILDDYNQNI